MIEMQMVVRMAKRAAVLAPILIVLLAVFAGPRASLSGAIGVAMTLGNLWAAARIIGGVADNNPMLLLIASMVAFTLGLALLGGIAYGLQALEVVSFPVVGFTLIGSHMVLVLGEAAASYPIKKQSRPDEVANARS